MRILVINGPNINMLGLREPEIYGYKDYSALLEYIHQAGKEAGVEMECMQSNHEGSIVDAIQSAYGKFDGIIINPAAYAHTSIAILDALKAVDIPAVEVHLSDIHTREEFRRNSLLSLVCDKTIIGKGFEGYADAIYHLAQASSGRSGNGNI